MPHKPPMRGAWEKPLLPVSIRLSVADPSDLDVQNLLSKGNIPATQFHKDQAAAQSRVEATTKAIEIVHANAGMVDAWVNTQRVKFDGGNIEVYAAQATFNDLNIAYQNHFGREVIFYTPIPPGKSTTGEESPAVPDIPSVNPIDPLAVEFADGAE